MLGGYTPSFLDEAIGNLVYDFGLKTVKQYLEIESRRESQWLVLINERTYPTWEDRRKKCKEPMVTDNHPAWYRLTDEGLVCKIWLLK